MPEKNNRIEWRLMGKTIGTATGWDTVDTFSIVILNFEANDVGRKFVPDFSGRHDLIVDWDRGEAIICDILGNERLLRTDWSVFNRDVETDGWRVDRAGEKA